ncbi:hypothetical protein PHYPSEUDO_009023 [Phytophthora pseudosyringae]|uniref:Uncharacterized protein n=1 Tax=Phytophthora pseudosyringae TaxID=221518 RepID=A0A8T1VDG8_9STRA|nr:hypothetical protein PHYPSEUDO_009023 [Phytophthora pseudosyringae]
MNGVLLEYHATAHISTSPPAPIPPPPSERRRLRGSRAALWMVKLTTASVTQLARVNFLKNVAQCRVLRGQEHPPQRGDAAATFNMISDGKVSVPKAGVEIMQLRARVRSSRTSPWSQLTRTAVDRLE